jgi:hypothetical protein
MPSTEIIYDPQVFHLPSKWAALPQNPRIVDQNGNVVGQDYVGHRFTVLCDAKLSESAFNKRRFRAILAIIFTVGIAYFCCDKIKSLLTQKYRQYIAPEEASLEDGEDALGNEVQIPQAVAERIQELLPNISQQYQAPKRLSLEAAEVELKKGMADRIQEFIPKISEQINDHAIPNSDHCKLRRFTISEAPEFLFTLGSEPDDQLLAARFKAIVFRKSIIMKYHLDLLQIPDTILIKIPTGEGDHLLMVERDLSYQADHNFQEDFYHHNQNDLKPIIKQLAKFIYQARLTGVSYSSCPLLYDDEGPLKCGILNVERDGSWGIHSLIYMMPNEELIDAVIEECKKYRSDFDFMEAKEHQLREIAAYSAYQKFLSQRDIQIGDEPVVSSSGMNSAIDSLGFRYSKVGFSLSMKGLKSNILKKDVESIIKALNKSILDNEGLHLEKRRLVYLDMNTDNLNHDQRLLYLKDVEKILEVLVEKEYIFKYTRGESAGLFEVQC